MRNIIKFINRKYVGECEINIFKNWFKPFIKINYFLRNLYIYIFSIIFLPFILFHKKYEDELDFLHYLIMTETFTLNFADIQNRRKNNNK